MGSSSERAEETTMSLFLKVRDSYQGLASLMKATKNRNSWLTSRTTRSRTPSHCLSPQGGIPRPLKSAQDAWNGKTCSSWSFAHVWVGFLLGIHLDAFVGDVLVGTESPRTIQCAQLARREARRRFQWPCGSVWSDYPANVRHLASPITSGELSYSVQRGEQR